MNIRNRTVAIVAAVVTASLSVGLNLAPASASTTPFTAQTPAGAALGVLVQFKHGVSARGPRGTLAHQDAVAALGIAIKGQRALGGGWHELRFTGVVSEDAAQRALKAMSAQPGVAKVSIDRVIRPAGYVPAVSSAAPKLSNTAILSTIFGIHALGAIKAASAPLKVVTKDAFSPAKPSVAAVTTSWSKPKSFFGASLLGYKVQASFNGGANSIPVGGVFSSKTVKVTLNSGLQPGIAVSVRIAAVTKLGKLTKVGAYSPWSTAIPTGLPQEPQFVALPINTDKPTLTWDALSLHEAGGLPITYTAKASADGHADVLCSSTTTSCTFTGLDAGVTYSVHLMAANKWGATAFVDPWPVADPYFKYQWQLAGGHGINVVGAWVRTQGSQDVTVAVIDSGITPHPDLDGQQFHNQDGSIYGYDFVSDPASSADGDGWDSNPTDESSDNVWHGTHVSGIVAAASNDIGVVGVAPGVKLEEIRALGIAGGTSADLIPALLWAGGANIPDGNGGYIPNNQHVAKVVNLSLGQPTPFGCDVSTQSAMQWLHDHGVSVVTAAGNDGGAALDSYPGNCFPTINVGSTGFTGTLAEYSNWGAGVDISAPGGDYLHPGTVDTAPDGQRGGIYSTINLGTNGVGQAGYGSLEGTSMAAPVVTGVIALLYSLKPSLTPDNVVSILRASASAWPAGSACATAWTAQQAAPNDYNIQSCGVGIVNADAALAYAAANY